MLCAFCLFDALKQWSGKTARQLKPIIRCGNYSSKFYNVKGDDMILMWYIAGAAIIRERNKQTDGRSDERTGDDEWRLQRQRVA